MRGLFAGLILLHLLPVWGFSHFLTQDGPAHLDSANVLRLYRHAGHPLFRTVYELNPSLEPNLLGHALASLLLSVLPAALAEKLLVSLYVVGLPLAVRYALRAVDAGGAFLAVLVFPFLLNWLLFMGFYNFALSLPLFFWALGYWWRHRLRLAVAHVAGSSVLGLLLYVSHVVSLVMALVVLAALAAWLEALELRRAFRSGEPLRLAPLASRGLRTLLALTPALLLLGEFLLRKGTAAPPPVPLAESWRRFRGLETLVVFGDAESWIAGLVFWGLALLTAFLLVARSKAPSLRGADGWLLAAAAATAVYFAAPRGMASGAALPERLIVFPPLLLLPWLAGHPFSPRARGLLQAAGASAALAFLGARLPVQRALDAQLQEYLSVRDSIPRGALLLSLCYQAKGLGPGGNPLPSRVAPFIHAAGYLAVEKDALQLANYEGNKGHFPIVFRPEWNPYTRMGPYGGIEADPPCVEFLTFGRSTGRPIDSVLTWGLEAYEAQSAEQWRERPHKFREARACVTSVREQLREGYELVDVSEPTGLARLYQRRR